MSETIPLERMRPDEIARLKIRYTNRDGSAEVLCSKAWAHIQLQDATIASLRAEVARLREGMSLIKQSALDRLRMDDEIVSLVDYYSATLASPAAEKGEVER